MERKISISLSDEQYNELVDALDISKAFWSNIQEEKADKIKELMDDIMRQKADYLMRQL